MIEVGGMVRVISDCDSFNEIGTVTKLYTCGTQPYATVEFKSGKYPKKQGYNINSLKEFYPLEDKEDIYSPEMIDGYFIVRTKGNSSQHYKCYSKDVKIGDKVIVENSNEIKTVIGVFNNKTAQWKNPTEEVIMIIDYSEYNKRKNKEKEIELIKLKLNSRIFEIQDRYKYEIYAEKDEEVKKLYDKLLELKGDNNGGR